MTGREEASESRAKGKVLAPSAGANEKAARLGSPGGGSLRTKGFAITDLLGLEAELQPPAASSVTGSGCEAGGAAVALGGGGPLPLGLGLLCGFASQQPAGAHCLLPAHIPFLQARPEHHHHHHHQYGPGAEKHKENISGKAGGPFPQGAPPPPPAPRLAFGGGRVPRTAGAPLGPPGCRGGLWALGGARFGLSKGDLA